MIQRSAAASIYYGDAGGGEGKEVMSNRELYRVCAKIMPGPRRGIHAG